jgi:hypothetical protein
VVRVKVVVNIGLLLKSISSGAQYVTLQKNTPFSHPSSVIHFFCNLTHKTGTGAVNWWEITNSKPPAPIIMMGQSEKHSAAVKLY